MIPLAHFLAPIALAAPVQGELATEPALLATIPESCSLEGPPLVAPDGTRIPVVHRVVWSPDGGRVAYVAVREGKHHPVVGEEVGDAFHFIDPPLFSSDGAHVAFRVGNRTSKTKERWWVLLDGEKTGAQDWIGALAFRPGTDELAYWTQPGAKIGRDGAYTGGDLVLLVGDKKGKKWRDAHALRPPTFTTDGKTAASLASKGGEWFVLLANRKGQKAAKEGFTMIRGLALAPDGKEWAAAVYDAAAAPGIGDLPPGVPAAMPGMRTVIRHGKETYGREYDSAGVPVFSPDGRHLAYKVKRGGAMGVALDGDERTPCEHEYVFTPVFSPDGKHIAYAVNEGGEVDEFWRMGLEGDHAVKGGKCRVVQHDLRGKKRGEGAPYLEIRDLTFAPDGDRLAYCGRKSAGWVLVVGEQESEPWDALGPPRFTPDGQRVAFGAREDRELWWRVMELD